jgi:DNA-binding FadR family transcriptional regulator
MHKPLRKGETVEIIKSARISSRAAARTAAGADVEAAVSLDTNPEALSLRRAQRGSSTIASQIRWAIMNDKYVSGDQLPPEREIARQFGSSRATVRNALRMLEEQKLITRKIGSGTFVAYAGAQADEEIAEVTSPLELIEVRLALEPHIVRLAVVHGTGRDMSNLACLLEEIEGSQDDHERFSQVDQNFHLGFAVATHNPLLVSMYRRVNAVRGHAQWSKMKDKILVPSRIREYNASHRLIYEAVNGRDADAAAELITAHLLEARRDLVGAKSG